MKKDRANKIAMNVSALTRKTTEDPKMNVKERSSTMISPRIKKHLKEKYGTISNAIQTLALKDMGEL